MKVFQVRDDVDRAWVGVGWGGKAVGLIPRAGKLNTSDDEANKDETTTPPPFTRMQPDGKVREKLQRGTSQ